MFYSVKNLNIFKNKTVIITGNTGFKGSWLSLWLKVLGAKVIGISKDNPTKPSNFQILKLNKVIKNYKCDLTNFKKLNRIILKNKPDFFFHLAAQALVKKSYANPLLTWNSNLIGTVNVLESLRFLNKKCTAVIITSDKSYKNLEIKRGYVEDDQLGGYDPYSASKGAAEFSIRSYVKCYFNKKSKIKIGIARAGNVIGGGDWSDDRLIPDCIKSWSFGKKVKIRNPNSTRPWQNVLEALSGYILLAAKLYSNSKLHGEAFNFGPNNKHNYTVKSIINEINIVWPSAKWSVVASKSKFKESNLLKLNCQKARSKVNWKSVLTFRENVSMTIEWYKSYYNKESNIDIKKFSENQIKKFSELIEKRIKL